MRTKRGNRYWCDFCNRAGLSAGHMRTHELHCTLNPARQCRVCKMLRGKFVTEFVPTPAPQLTALLTPLPNFISNEELEAWQAATRTAVARIREAVGDCPACMMSVLRLAKIPLPMVESFNYTDEMKAIWDGINQDQFERDHA